MAQCNNRPFTRTSGLPRPRVSGGARGDNAHTHTHTKRTENALSLFPSRPSQQNDSAAHLSRLANDPIGLVEARDLFLNHQRVVSFFVLFFFFWWMGWGGGRTMSETPILVIVFIDRSVPRFFFTS